MILRRFSSSPFDQLISCWGDFAGCVLRIFSEYVICIVIRASENLKFYAFCKYEYWRKQFIVLFVLRLNRWHYLLLENEFVKENMRQ